MRPPLPIAQPALADDRKSDTTCCTCFLAVWIGGCVLLYLVIFLLWLLRL